MSFGYLFDVLFVLCDFNLKIRVGEFVVLVGVLGVGKFMLCVLILCFYDVSVG